MVIVVLEILHKQTTIVPLLFNETQVLKTVIVYLLTETLYHKQAVLLHRLAQIEVRTQEGLLHKEVQHLVVTIQIGPHHLLQAEVVVPFREGALAVVAVAVQDAKQNKSRNLSFCFFIISSQTYTLYQVYAYNYVYTSNLHNLYYLQHNQY